MYVCIYVCMYVCVFENKEGMCGRYMNTYMHDIFTYSCMYIHQVSIKPRRICGKQSDQVERYHPHTYMSTYIHTYIHIHTHIHTHIHICTHTRIHVRYFENKDAYVANRVINLKGATVTDTSVRVCVCVCVCACVCVCV